MHVEALKILNLAAQNPTIVDELIDIGSIPRILNCVQRAADPKLFAEALGIVARVANTSNGRKVIFFFSHRARLTLAMQIITPKFDRFCIRTELWNI